MTLRMKQAAMRTRIAQHRNYRNRSERDQAVLSVLKRHGLEAAHAEAKRWQVKP
jgi:hypothetical protein